MFIMIQIRSSSWPGLEIFGCYRCKQGKPGASAPPWRHQPSCCAVNIHVRKSISVTLVSPHGESFHFVCRPLLASVFGSNRHTSPSLCFLRSWLEKDRQHGWYTSASATRTWIGYIIKHEFNSPSVCSIYHYYYSFVEILSLFICVFGSIMAGQSFLWSGGPRLTKPRKNVPSPPVALDLLFMGIQPSQNIRTQWSIYFRRQGE